MAKHVGLSVISGSIHCASYSLSLQRREEALHRRNVPDVAGAAHAVTDGIDGAGNKHLLVLIEGATENATVVQALIDNLIERGRDPKVCRLFIIDGARALTKVIRSTFGRRAPIQRCQVHKARNR